ncbi:hypothetical protein E2562_025263 [Oryza meyeriana var. granulata]|uniref:Uncharacterized protein n=1 Tax=Oryza meyeriana var. granulata TaxID=110450 RepID=A0A6G1BZW2_9ORYZ|nr:hypothetical protein E2562_025263 [Oryza meyeriana var. granulata]
MAEEEEPPNAASEVGFVAACHHQGRIRCSPPWKRSRSPSLTSSDSPRPAIIKATPRLPRWKKSHSLLASHLPGPMDAAPWSL